MDRGNARGNLTCCWESLRKGIIMPEETTKQETKQEDSTQFVEVDGNKVSIDELRDKYRNSRKLVTEYQGARAEANTLKEEIKQLQEKLESHQKAQDDGKLRMDEEDSQRFVEKLVTTVNTMQDRLNELDNRVKQEREERAAETKTSIARKNLQAVKEFAKRRGMEVPKSNDIKEWSEELQGIADLATKAPSAVYHQNPGMIEITDDAMDDAWFLLHRKEIEAKSKEQGAGEVLQELFGNKKKEKKIDSENPDLQWLAQNWHKLSAEDRKKYRKQVYGAE